MSDKGSAKLAQSKLQPTPTDMRSQVTTRQPRPGRGLGRFAGGVIKEEWRWAFAEHGTDRSRSRH